jgi:hypothetical protein
MKTIWFDPKWTAEERDNHKRGLANDVYLRQLREILEDELRELERKEITPDYTSPSWSHLQAHRNGDKYRLIKILDLLNFEQE